jgi:hypothetical protein
MSTELTIDQAIDIGYSVLNANLNKAEADRIRIVMGEQTYRPLNELWKLAETDGGDLFKFWVSLKDTGNGGHKSHWSADTRNVINTDVEGQVSWAEYSTNMTYNRVELAVAMSRGDLQVYNYLVSKRQKMFAEAASDIMAQLILSPASSTDKFVPFGISTWLSRGTDNTDPAWTGYLGRYNDGSGTTFNSGNITSTSSVNTRWASLYADHNGNLGDNLINLIEECLLMTDFQAPQIPQAVLKDSEITGDNCILLTTKAVIKNMRQLYRKSDDNIGTALALLHNSFSVNGISALYVPQMDTPNTYLWGTNPVYGVKKDRFKIKVLEQNNFIVGKPYQSDVAHNVITVPMDVSYALACDDRRFGGFLISQQ